MYGHRGEIIAHIAPITGFEPVFLAPNVLLSGLKAWNILRVKQDPNPHFLALMHCHGGNTK